VRHSGDRITSSGNFLIEYLATLCCVLDDPLEALLQVRSKIDHNDFKKFWNQSETRREIVDFNGKCCQIKGEHALYCCVVEGDDVIARLEAPVMVENDEIISRYHELGLDGKVQVETGSGTVNFCGMNFLIDEGNTEKSVYSPDIIRALGKVGTAKNDQTDESIYSSSLVRAAEFAGRQDWVANIFKNVADNHHSTFRLNKEQIMHHGNVGKSEILERYKTYYNTEKGLSLEKQAQLLVLSMKDGLTPIRPLEHYNLDDIINDIVKLNMINWNEIQNNEAVNVLPDYLAKFLSDGAIVTFSATAVKYDEQQIVVKSNYTQPASENPIESGIKKKGAKRNGRKRKQLKQRKQQFDSIQALATSIIFDSDDDVRPCFMPD